MPNWKTYESSVRLLSAIVAAHPELKLNYAVISKHFGSDSTGGGIEFQFRKIKSEAKRQRACVSSGGDPLSLGIGSGGGTDAMAHFYRDTTPTALQHVFRPIKKDAMSLLAEFGPADGRNGGGAISNNYGEGTTAKAISTYFERTRKDPQYNLSNTMEENSNGAPGSASKAGSARKRAAPASAGKKRPAKAAKKESDDDDVEEDDNHQNDSDDDTVVETPSKKVKTAPYKVKGARVTQARATRPAPGFFADQDDTEVDLTDDAPAAPKPAAQVKKEVVAPYIQTNGNGHTNGRSPGSAKKDSIPSYYTNGAQSFPPYGNGVHGNGNGYGNAHASFSGYDQPDDGYMHIPDDEGGA